MAVNKNENPPDQEKVQEKLEYVREPYVSYSGKESVRTVSKDDWAKAGVSDQDTISWTRTNNREVVKDRLSQTALEVLLQDPAFAVVE